MQTMHRLIVKKIWHENCKLRFDYVLCFISFKFTYMVGLCTVVANSTPFQLIGFLTIFKQRRRRQRVMNQNLKHWFVIFDSTFFQFSCLLYSWFLFHIGYKLNHFFQKISPTYVIYSISPVNDRIRLFEPVSKLWILGHTSCHHAMTICFASSAIVSHSFISVFAVLVS